MIVLWSDEAAADLLHFHTWLSEPPDAKPSDVIGRIRVAGEAMTRLGDIGRPRPVAGVRELSVRTDPYMIAYRIDGEEIVILAVYHTAQNR